MKLYTDLTPEYLSTLDIPIVKDKNGAEYLNIEAGFDTENTSFLYGEVKTAFTYIGMLGIGLGNDIFYARSWDEIKIMFDTVSNYFKLNFARRLMVFVHNLKYDFHFMRKHFQWEDIFAIGTGEPVKAITDKGIEFRCSYKLSGSALNFVAKNLVHHKVKKLVGDLDYDLIRHHETPLTEQELAYCNNDIEIILAYIKEQLIEYKTVNKIPLTNTGRVREYVRNKCFGLDAKRNNGKPDTNKKNAYLRRMQILKLTPEIYLQLKNAFMGGFTHSNTAHTEQVLFNVSSYDLTSSYPSVMLAEKFPMARAKRMPVVKSLIDLRNFGNDYCFMLDVRLTGLRNKFKHESYISHDPKQLKVKSVNPVLHNGRIYSADMVVLTCTDIDLEIIDRVYEYDEIAISNVIGFGKGYLPKDIQQSILDLYQNKTALKGVEGEEVEYLKSKGMLNSIYGMTVTDIVKDENMYEDDEWNTEPADINEAIHQYNESRQRFLFYAWGIWVTAYARRNLWSAIFEMGEDYIYADTDSVKFFNKENHLPYFERYNKEVTDKLAVMAKTQGFDISLLSPKTVEGIEKPMGVWEFEGDYSHFKTLGAKRYLVRKGDKYELTVAGLPKSAGMKYISEVCGDDCDKIFATFDTGLHIPAGKSGKLKHTAISNEYDILVTDYLGNTVKVETLSGLYMEPTSFNMDMDSNYLEIVRDLIAGYAFTGNKRS